MTDDPVQTWMDTDGGEVHFQVYLVQRGARDSVHGVRFRGIDAARPARGVLDALESAEAIIIAPSNPIVSIGPILGVPGIRSVLRRRRERVAAVSPIVAGAAIKGPAVEIMRGLGVEASALGVARLYSDIVGLLVIDQRDDALSFEIEKLGIRTLARETVMKGIDEWSGLAGAVLEGALQTRSHRSK
jgi:LPPG:FO 2-phospho-L-lactate transferase